MKEDLAIARNSLLALQAENQAMRQSSTQTAQSHSDNISNGSGSDKEKAQQSEAVSAELAEERKKNVELDKELKLQVSLKAESDMAMKLLEKDIHEKQDTIVSLRRQLDDIKQINLEMYRKLQVRISSQIISIIHDTTTHLKPNSSSDHIHHHQLIWSLVIGLFAVFGLMFQQIRPES